MRGIHRQKETTTQREQPRCFLGREAWTHNPMSVFCGGRCAAAHGPAITRTCLRNKRKKKKRKSLSQTLLLCKLVERMSLKTGRERTITSPASWVPRLRNRPPRGGKQNRTEQQEREREREERRVLFVRAMPTRKDIMFERTQHTWPRLAPRHLSADTVGTRDNSSRQQVAASALVPLCLVNVHGRVRSEGGLVTPPTRRPPWSDLDTVTV
jgi:hypothetical protein